MGSAPIKSSVKSPTIYPKNFISIKKQSQKVNLVRDLYQREEQLSRIIKRVKEIDEPDKTDLLKLIDHMQIKERSALWIVRCMGSLLTLRKPLGKPYREASSQDIKRLLEWIFKEGYGASSDEKFRQALKLFYKVVFGNNRYHPEQVSFFNSEVGHDRKNKKITYEQVLNEDQIKLVIDTALTLQEKAFCACLYETGARPEEFLRLTNLDIDDQQENGIGVILRGKTGERSVRIISYASLLLQWLEVHPQKNDNVYSLWLSEATNFKNKPLGIAGAEKRIRKIFAQANLNKKKIPKPYTMRHTRATHLANILTHAQMCYTFGWDMNSDKPNIYIHLSGADITKTLFQSYKSGDHLVKNEPKLVPTNCIRCNDTLYPNAQFCYKCGTKTDKKELYADIDRDRKIKELDDKIERLSFMVQQSMENFMKFQIETTADFLEHAMRCFKEGLELKITKREVSADELFNHFMQTKKQNPYSIEDIKLVKSLIKPIKISEIDVKNINDINK
jgi:site-specific recombinase XerD